MIRDSILIPKDVLQEESNVIITSWGNNFDNLIDFPEVEYEMVGHIHQWKWKPIKNHKATTVIWKRPRGGNLFTKCKKRYNGSTDEGIYCI